jgi:thiamine-phosphate pyrophosphorylase
MKLDFDLYFITDRGLSKRGIMDDVRAAIRGGVRIVQYREKEFPVKRMIREAAEIRQLCRKSNVVFIVNDRVDVALASGADGVHIGPDDMDLPAARKIMGEDKIIGVSAGTLEDAMKFEKQGADYLGIGPVFETPTKTDAGKPTGVGLLRKVRVSVKIPFVAIGGITRDNLADVLDAGCRRVCMISAIVPKDDVGAEVREIRRIINEHPA